MACTGDFQMKRMTCKENIKRHSAEDKIVHENHSFRLNSRKKKRNEKNGQMQSDR